MFDQSEHYDSNSIIMHWWEKIYEQYYHGKILTGQSVIPFNVARYLLLKHYSFGQLSVIKQCTVVLRFVKKEEE